VRYAGYSNTLYGIEHMFEKVPVPVALKAAVSGLLLGMLALPEIHATGYPVMRQALKRQGIYRRGNPLWWPNTSDRSHKGNHSGIAPTIIFFT